MKLSNIKNLLLKKAEWSVRYYIPICSIFFMINLIVATIGAKYTKYKGIERSPVYLIVYSVLALIVVVICSRIIIKSIKQKLKPSISGWGMGIFLTVLFYLLGETIISGYALKHKLVFIIAAPLFMYIFYLPGAFLFKSPRAYKIYYGTISVVAAFYGALQYFVYIFRGTPIRASDFNSLVSAMEISSEYSVVTGFGPVILLLCIVTLVIAFVVLAKTEIKPIKSKTRIGFGAGFAVLILSFSLTNTYLFDYGIDTRQIKLNFSGMGDIESYQYTGNALLLYLDVTNSGSPKPENYSADNALKVMSKYKDEEDRSDKKPTVIVVMDESFADFAKLGELKTNKDYIPFYNGLTENTVKGYVTVSAYGGYSCNSEFEFLTGNSMAFYSTGSAAYTQYVKTPQDSLVSYFSDRGYKTVAMAACERKVWNLERAYGCLGFDETHYDGEYNWESPEYVNGRVSDRTFFKRVIDRYENKGEEPMFLFVTTMQNHSPYNAIDDPSIKLEDIECDVGEGYLSAIHETDKAVEELVTYFSNVDDDVVIAFYGDHFPHIPDFSEKLLKKGLGNLSYEDNANLHSTPYFIWANYDIEEKQNNNMSLNYLSCELLDVCGAPKTDFHLYLEDVKKEIPFMCSFGYMGNDNKWYAPEEKSPYSDKFYEYSVVQYYRLFEKYSKE